MVEESGKRMSFGEDGILDAHGNPLPVLSKSASMMKIDRLMKTPLPTFHGNTPGSPFWTQIVSMMLKATIGFQFRSYEVTGKDKIPTARGSLCCSWHTNGLIDPATIMTSHPKRFVVGGRHDLVTRPLIGFWARRIAVQPVVRQAELIRGGCSPEVAATLNGRSLLNLSTGISHGFGCFLFPEGTSHNEAHLLRLKTGPMRTALSAAALAKGQGRETPVIIPIGLHWRIRHHWRTDAWVEFGQPIELPAEELGDEIFHQLSTGKWAEPPAELVNRLRDELRIRLEYLTPNAEDWTTYNAWHLLGRLEGGKEGKLPITWQDEVRAARNVRERLAKKPEDERLSKAREVATILEKNHLDARAIDAEGGIRKAKISAAPAAITRLVMALLFLPLFIPSCFIQALVGKILGDKNIENEGLDARTSYQFLASMFGSFFLWPPIALIISSFLILYCEITVLASLLDPLTSQVLKIIALAIILIPLILISAISAVRGWDALEDLKRARRRVRLRGSDDGDKVKKLCAELLL
jgi:1-acyl-sn-glycerol-3-phosphate acyltransferase